MKTGLLIGPEDDESPVVDQHQIGNVNLIWRKLKNIDNLPNVQTRTTNHTATAISQLPEFNPGFDITLPDRESKKSVQI